VHIMKIWELFKLTKGGKIIGKERGEEGMLELLLLRAYSGEGKREVCVAVKNRWS